MPVVVITGSARGFGLCQAKKFKELGYNVVISDINEENLKKALLGHRMGILGCSTAEMKMNLGC